MGTIRQGVVGVLVLCLVASLSVAEEGQEEKKREGRRSRRPDGAARFAAMDKDGNGSVSLEEYKVDREKRMAAYKERAGDRWDEARAAKMPSAEESFKKMDANADGAVTQEEMTEARKKRMESYRAAREARKKKEE